MSEPAPTNKPRLLSPRKTLVQLLGFAVGLALLGWCISVAIRGDGWEKLQHAHPALIAGLAACSLLSFFANGATFWLVIRPIQPLRFRDMQWLNLVTAVLNYAPIRLGLLARVAYHLRVDQMSLLRIGAWFAALTYMLGLTLGACVLATILRPRFDLVWLSLLLGQLVVGGVITGAIMGQPLTLRFSRGMERMLREPACLWGGMGLRLVDTGAFVGRMAFAAAILDLQIGAADTMLLGFAALFMSLNPLGRMGYREVTVAFVAAQLFAGSVTGEQLEAQMATLALVESAGEAMVAIPLGGVALLWYRKRWREAGERNGTEPEAAEAG